MTELLEDVETIAPDERPTLGRRVEVGELELDGRNVYLRCVPWDVPAMVADPPPVGDGQPYEESFARGAFDSVIDAPNRVYLEVDHFQPGLSGVVGFGSELESAADALYGRFRVLKGSDGDKALELIAEKVLTAASVYFQPIRNARTANGVRRLKARLDRVALCRVGSYVGAEVLAVRHEAPAAVEEVPAIERLPGLASDLRDALTARGITIPDRLSA